MNGTLPSPSESFSLETLVGRAHAWCAAHRVNPPSGQPGQQLTVRTARYYRALGLLDGPAGPPKAGYGRRHFLQLCAVRILQAKGLPLDRIQTLLYARPDSDLERILESASSGPSSAPGFDPAPGRMESWQALPITPDILLVLRNGARLTPAQREGLERLFTQSGETEHPR